MTRFGKSDGGSSEEKPVAATTISGRRLGSVIAFPRLNSAAGSGAAGDPPSPAATFEPIGPILQSVVMRIKESRARIRVLRAAGEGDSSSES